MLWRPARRDEVPAVAALLAEDHRGAPPRLFGPALFAAYDALAADRATDLIVGLRGTALVATYQLTLVHRLALTAPCRAMLEGVRVRSDLRGAGIGALLIADALARARARGAVMMELMSNTSRADARRFYERHGFEASHTGFRRPLD